MSDQINSLDKLAGFHRNRISNEINLGPWMGEAEVKHLVKPAQDYRDELIGLLAGEADSQKGTPLPWHTAQGKFELRAHEMTVWTGFKGHGKSLALSQVLVTAMGRGEKAFIISPEFRPARVMERMLYQHIRSKAPGSDDVTRFLNFANERLWLYDTQASLKPAHVIALCRYVAQEIGVKHILIDSLMKCGIPSDDYNGQKRFVDQVQRVCHNEPVHIHLVAHARKGDSDDKPAKLHDIKGASELADMAENIVSVWRNKPKEKDEDKHKGEPDAIVVVEAQRNADGWIGSIPLMFDQHSALFHEPGFVPERGGEYVNF